MTNDTPSMLDDGWWSRFTAEFADYDLGTPIGFGAFSTVYSAVFRPPALDDRDDHIVRPETRECAIKVSSSHPDIDQLFKEAKMLGLSRHPNILRILATFTLPPDHRRIAIVTPLIAGGSLAGILDWRSRLTPSLERQRFPRFHLGARRVDAVQDNGKLGEEEIKAVVKQALEGLVYLHGRGFLHRDLKAGNLLIAPDGTVLLADFGVGGDLNEPSTTAVEGRSLPAADEVRFGPETPRPGKTPGSAIKKSTAGYVGKRNSFVGTPSWMAPEVVLGQQYDAKADIWSLGITILELVYGSVPGIEQTPSAILSHTVNDAQPSLDRGSGGFSKHMKEFVDGCLCKDAKQRSTAAQALEHVWMKGAKRKAFLAESLLGDVPPLEHRQEIRRIPTKSSLNSFASTWDLSATPSISNSPVRSSPLRSAGLRTPSIASQLHDYFPSAPSRTHSRTSSRLPSMPPSPRTPLRQWAESTHEESSPSRRRTGSETGGLKSPSKMRLRRGQSASFDERRSADDVVILARRTQARRVPSTEDGFGSDEARGFPMSPLIEVHGTSSMEKRNIPAVDLRADRTNSDVGTSIQAMKSITPEGTDLFLTSPANIAAEIPADPSTPFQRSSDLPVSPVSTQVPDSESRQRDRHGSHISRSSSHTVSKDLQAIQKDKADLVAGKKSTEKGGKGWGAGLIGSLIGRKHHKN